MIEYNKLDNWVAGYFIRNNQNIGTVVPIEETANSDWKYQMFQVSKGDKIYCKFTGGNSARAIAILDDEYKLVYNSGVNLAIDETYEIEQDGFVILNTWTVEPLAYHYPFSQDNTDLGRVYTTHNHGEDTTEEYQARNIGKGYIQDNNYQPGDFNVNEQMTLMGKYGVTKIGNQLWITENLDEELGTLGVDEWYYNGRSKIGAQINYNTTVTTSSWSSLSTDSITFYNWEDGKISGTTATGFAIPCVDRKVTISFDYEYASDVSETKSFAVYVNGFRKDGTYSQGSWCGTSPSYSSKSGSMKFTTTLSNEIELLQTMRFTSLISGNKITIRNLRIVWGNTMSTTLVTLPQALANEEIAKANNYGKLYDWNNINDNLSKLNLNGWRVPTTDDSDKFFEIDNTLMKFFKKSLGGSDIYGFGLFGAGVWSGTSFSVSNVGRYWSSNKSNDVAYRFLAFDGPLSIYRSSYGALYQGASIRLVLDLNPDGSYPEDATPLKPRETYKPYNRNIGTGAKPYIPNDDGKVYVDDVRCDIVCPHDKPETSETNSISLASEPIIEE